MLLINKVQLEIKKMLAKDVLTEKDYQHLDELRVELMNSLPELNKDISSQSAYYKQVQDEYNLEDLRKKWNDTRGKKKLKVYNILNYILYAVMGVVCIVNISNPMGIYYLIILVLFIWRDRKMNKKINKSIQDNADNVVKKGQDVEVAGNNLKIYLKRKEITEMFLSLIDGMQKNEVPSAELGHLLALIDEYMLKPSNESQLEKVDGSWQLDDGLNFKLVSRN